jgi:hypothetical protein
MQCILDHLVGANLKNIEYAFPRMPARDIQEGAAIWCRQPQIDRLALHFPKDLGAISAVKRDLHFSVGHFQDD